jgi:hypothetical protein
MNSQESMVYLVKVYRADLPDGLLVFNSQNELEAKTKFLELEESWIKSVEDKRPFRITTPHLSAFSPNLIKEIKVEEIPFAEYERLNSHYEKQLKELGMTGFMNRNFQR